MTEPVQRIDTDSAEGFLSALSVHAQPFCKDESSLWLFRGQSNVSYPLVPTVLRKESFPYCSELAGIYSKAAVFKECEAFQVWLEVALLRRFLEMADDAGLAMPDMGASTLGRLNGYMAYLEKLVDLVDSAPALPVAGELFDQMQLLTLELEERVESPQHATWPLPYLQRHLALARHSGLPTRLLDWSKSPRIAAYFAAAGAARRVWEGDGGSERMGVWAFSKSARGPWNIEDLQVSGLDTLRLPLDMNRNMFAQWGVFTTNTVTPKDLLRMEIDRRPADVVAQDVISKVGKLIGRVTLPAVVHITAPVQAAPEVLWMLSKEGLTKNRLFPEFASVVEAMHEEILYVWPEAYDDEEDNGESEIGTPENGTTD